ncbi:potassium channel family protein [Natranaerovirga hydrolytica]|uniref:potassium channel family protein n=1 Tax=Natranaerovirga hydrolytica TaxID=680378 RepID=UPI00104E8329|nr:potassium channel family protein [Natranaerovirga hydrolytica]
MQRENLSIIKKNIPDLIAIIPFSSVFRLARLTRLARIIRLSKVSRVLRTTIWLSKFKDKIVSFLKTNGLIYMIMLTITINCIGALLIYKLEDMTIVDSFWWSFVTTTTVGYGDISPNTIGGKVLAAILMLVGIGFIGMLTGTIATYFLKDVSETKTYQEEIIKDIQQKLDDFEDLSNDDIDSICMVLKTLSNENREKTRRVE